MSDAFRSAYKFYANKDLATARSALETILREAPGDKSACFLLGLIDLEEGVLEGGLKRMADGSQGYAPPAELCHRAGRLLFERKEFEKAKPWLIKAVRQNPDFAASHYWLGNAMRMTGDAKGAEAALEQAVKLAPKEARASVSLAFLHREQGRLDEAAETMMTLAKAMPEEAETHQKVAEFLADIQRLDLAEKLLTKVAEKESDNSVLLTRLGQIRQKLGLFEEAAQCFRRAIIRNASSDAAYLGLSVVKKYATLEDADAIIMAKAIENNEVSEDTLICAHFALGKVHDDCKSYNQAFQHYQKANQLKAKKAAFDKAKFKDLVKRTKKTFKAAYFKSLAARDPSVSQKSASVPVFIVGMLRSGTTLAEQVLDAHPEIFGAGELNFIDMLAEALGKDVNEPYPDYMTGVSVQDLQSAAGYYMKMVTDMSQGEALLVDKNPLNFMHLGLIASLFPTAKIIHCRRNVLDTAVSLYFQHFAHDANAYSYDLKNIAEVTIEYRGLMDHWYKALPLPIFDLDYEHLVKFPEKVTQKLLYFLEVDWDDAVLDFYQQDKAVETASLWQVKQPL